MKIPQQTQEPITTDVPLGLDEPAPILVWRSGARLVRPANPPYYAVFLSEESAIKGRQIYMSRYPGFFRIETDPFRMPLSDTFGVARQLGYIAVQVCSESMQVIEEYPL